MFDWLKKIFINRYAAVLIGAAVGYITKLAEQIGVPSEVVGQFEQAANAVFGAIVIYLVTKGFDLKKSLEDKKK